MRGDFSRIPQDSGHYSAVLMQQGRILVDADWNAATGTSLWAQRALAADVIGPHGGPRDNLGFRPTPIDQVGRTDLELNPGVYYVDGIRCELPAGLVPTGHDGMPWNQQPYPIAEGPVELPLKPYLAYLDVWERHVGVLEDGSLRDVALNGSDTTTRRQVIWQVRVISYPPDLGTPSGDAFPLSDWRVKLRGEPPRLRATTAAPGLGQDPRLAPPNAGFRGAENQLYRVEIVSGAGDSEAGDPALFVWSRENGSVAATWTDTTGNHLHVVGVGDDRLRFTAGDWVELTWDALEFAGVAGTRVQLIAADSAVLTIDQDTASGPIEPDPASRPHAKIRRWDQRGTDATPLVKGAVEVVESETEWIFLEDGVWIQFAPGETDTPYRVGDYWTIPARTATADIDWPHATDGEPLSLPPQGPQHHYAPLVHVAEENVSLQRAFRPLAAGC